MSRKVVRKVVGVGKLARKGETICLGIKGDMGLLQVLKGLNLICKRLSIS